MIGRFKPNYTDSSIKLNWRLRVKRRKKIPMQTQNKAPVALLVTDKVDFRTENITMNKEVHFVMIRESIKKI